jgi:hypothetical protein
MEEKKKEKRSPKDRLKYIQDWQKRLESQYSKLKDERMTAMRFRDSDPSIVTVLEGRSKVTTTDMQDAIDMAKPDILEQIAGIDEPLKLDPDEAKYVEPVKKLQVLGNVMVKRKNKWFRVCSDFLDDSMVLKFGCIKYRWIEEKKTIEKVYENLQDVELQSLLQKEGAAISSTEEDQAQGITKIKYSTVDEYVRYDAVPSERIRFPLDTRDFAEAPIVIEEIRLYEHEFIRDYGKKSFDKIKEIKEALDKDKPDAVYEARFKHVGGLGFLYEKKSDKYKAYEAYFWEGDKPWVMTFCADEVLLDEENKYGKPPYRGGSAFLVAHALLGKGYIDCIKSIQERNTDYQRKLTDIFNQNSYRRYFANIEGCGMNIDDYENNSSAAALIRCTGQLEGNILPETKTPITSDMFQYGEMLEREKDKHIPTPRAFAGIEGAKDERTYRGKQLKVNQASKKLLLMMRGYMEEVFAPLFQDTLDCIAKFMKKKTIVRYLNEDYEIDPEEIVCKYAMVVNVGLGAHDKQDLIVKLQQLIGLAMKEMQTGIITPQNLFYMNQELVKAMGFLNTMDFVTDPKLKETMLEFIHAVVALMQHFGDMHQQEPEMQQIMGHMGEMIQKVLSSLGIQQEKPKGGSNVKGTQEGEKPAAVPEQPLNPQTQITGGGYFA